MKGCSFTLMFGFKLSKVFLREVVFGIPKVRVECPTCLCRLVISTTSESKRPSVPTPAPAKYRAVGQPIPPDPMRAIL